MLDFSRAAEFIIHPQYIISITDDQVSASRPPTKSTRPSEAMEATGCSRKNGGSLIFMEVFSWQLPTRNSLVFQQRTILLGEVCKALTTSR